MRWHQAENAFSLNYATSKEQQTKENNCLHLKPVSEKNAIGFVFNVLYTDLFIHLNMAVLRLAGLTADWLGLGPGFEDLAQRTGDWQACHTDPI